MTEVYIVMQWLSGGTEPVAVCATLEAPAAFCRTTVSELIDLRVVATPGHDLLDEWEAPDNFSIERWRFRT